MAKYILEIDEKELTQLIQAVEVHFDITDDMSTEDLFMPKDQETINREQLEQIRVLVNARIDDVAATASLLTKVRLLKPVK